ncbi:MAG: ATP-grasp domain-containing protein [Pseudomonadota bacterium]
MKLNDAGAGCLSPPASVLLIAPSSSYRIGAYASAAASLGVRLVVASDGQYSLVPEVAEGIHVDFGGPGDAAAKLAAAHARQPYATVLASDDATVELASQVAALCGLPHNPLDSARVSRRKDLARARQRAAGLDVPEFALIELDSGRLATGDLPPFPCVLKPLALSGSRGVMRVDTPAALDEARVRLRRIVGASDGSAERRYGLVESFMPGTEVAVEGILSNGQLEILAVFDKPAPLDGPFFEESYYVTPSRLEAPRLQRVQDCVAAMCAAYGLTTGPVHAELRVFGDRVRPLELASRTIGGDCARLLRFGTGHSLEELVLARALGLSISARPTDVAGGVLMIPIPRSGVLRRVEGVLQALAVPLVEDVFIAAREGHELVALPEGSSYLGFVFARGPGAAEVYAALREAHALLRVVIAPMWRIEVAS